MRLTGSCRCAWKATCWMHGLGNRLRIALLTRNSMYLPRTTLFRGVCLIRFDVTSSCISQTLVIHGYVHCFGARTKAPACALTLVRLGNTDKRQSSLRNHLSSSYQRRAQGICRRQGNRIDLATACIYILKGRRVKSNAQSQQAVVSVEKSWHHKAESTYNTFYASNTLEQWHQSSIFIVLQWTCLCVFLWSVNAAGGLVKDVCIDISRQQ